MEQMLQQVDGYCERLGPGFWAEPLNAVSNAAFLVAALLGWMAARRAGRGDDWAVLTLTGVLTAIGVGSFLFHTYATRWAGIADVAPIMLFILLYLHLALVRFLGLSRLPAAGLTAAFMLLSPFVGEWLTPVTGTLNGSIMYAPTWLLMAAVGGVLALMGHPAWRGVAGAAGLLAISLVFRTLDAQEGPVCAAFPAGLHWGWHLFNGALLGLLIATLARHGAAPARRGAGRPRVARGEAAG